MEEAAKAKIVIAGAWDDPDAHARPAKCPHQFRFQHGSDDHEDDRLSQNIPLAGQKGLQNKASREEAQAATEGPVNDAGRTGIIGAVSVRPISITDRKRSGI